MSRLARFPNHAGCEPIAEVAARDLDEKTFERDYVRRCRPLVIRGLAAHWPACGHWTFDDVARRLRPVDNVFAGIGALIEEPFGEYGHADAVGLSPRELMRERRRRTPALSGAAFLARMEAAETLTAYAVSMTDGSGLASLRRDGLGDIDFYAARRRSRFYQARAFIYKRGYTDWHFHYADDTFTTQVVGDKQFVLLPPDRDTFDVMWSACRRGLIDGDRLSSRPESARLRPQSTVLRPGDTIYLPVFWWHAVESCGDAPGLTVTEAFRTPSDIQLDLRFAAARWNVRSAASERGYRRMVPLLLAGGVYALLRHPFRPPHLHF